MFHSPTAQHYSLYSSIFSQYFVQLHSEGDTAGGNPPALCGWYATPLPSCTSESTRRLHEATVCVKRSAGLNVWHSCQARYVQSYSRSVAHSQATIHDRTLLYLRRVHFHCGQCMQPSTNEWRANAFWTSLCSLTWSWTIVHHCSALVIPLVCTATA